MTFNNFVRGSLAIIGATVILAPMSDPSARFVIGPAIVAIAILFPWLVSLAVRMHNKRTVYGTFYWTGDLPDDEAVGLPPATKVSDDFGEQWQYQATEPVANSVYLSALETRIASADKKPCPDDHGWYIEFVTNDRTCDLLLQWVPDGDRRDCFRFDAWYRHRSLTRGGAAERQHETLRKTVVSILEMSDCITDVSLNRRMV